jgi:hypothetical protein
MNDQNKSAEQIKSEALEESFFQTFGCSSAEFFKDWKEVEKQLAEFVKKEYPNAK